jgi:DNA-binding response OmpR family regulator
VSGRVLIVDPDAVTRRMVELAIGALPGWTVESAREGGSAFEILKGETFDIILSERNLPDMTGLHFHRRLLQESRLRSVPFLILSIDAQLEYRLAALRAGVDDYLLKPFDSSELRARIESHVGRSRRTRELGRGRRYLLAGDFSALAFPDLISTLSLQRCTGTLAINTQAAMGMVHLQGGEVVHAAFGTLIGNAAFNAVFRAPNGQFEFTPEPSGIEPAQRTIHDSVTGLIMEAARLMDEGVLLAPVPPPSRPPANNLSDVVRHPPRTLARAFASTFQDPFSLGELFFWTSSELSAWTRRESSERLHVHLIADLAGGLGAVLPLSSAPGERQMLAALRGGPRLPGLVYFLRGERQLDLLVIDIDSPLSDAASMRRNPTLTIVAPPRGDGLEIGTRSKLGIKTLLGLRPPELVVGLGNGSMKSFFEHTLEPGVDHFIREGALEDGELREVMTDALLAWGTFR